MTLNIEALKAMIAAAAPGTLKTDADCIDYQRQKAYKKALGALSPARRQFLGHYDKEDHPAEFNALRDALKSGAYARPSAYVDTQMNWLFDEFIPESRRQEALDAVDRCLTQPYDTYWCRRSLRSSTQVSYAKKIQQVLQHFANDVLLPYDVADLLAGQVPEAVHHYLGGESWRHDHRALPCRIAGALDQGDERVAAAVREILVGDGKAVLLREVIQGVIQSDRSDMHELLGQLLLAARLQEGLRQVICENADMGTESAFLSLLAVIDDNNLIRFSAVKRAVGVWLGLMTEESGDLERVSGKSVTLIRRCLTDSAFREECLASQDSMAIHIALWSVGFRDVQEAVRRAGSLALNGTHHQRLTCGYFITTLNEPDAASRLARSVIPAFPEELDTLALYLPWLTPSLLRELGSSRRDSCVKLTDYYADEAECRQMIELLMQVRAGLKKKLVFDPCVFPWHSAKLDKSLLAANILASAALLEDDALLDSLLPLLPETPVDNCREYLLKYCCGNPRTPVQRQTLLTALCDKGEWIRRAAVKLVQELPLTAEDYPVLESLLRFKYADVRPTLLVLLCQQEDDALYGSVSHLIADKTEERRIAALDIVRSLIKQDTRHALIERCRPLIADFAAPTAKEKPLLESIRKLLGEKTEEPADAPLYTAEDVYRPQPVIDDTLAEAAETFARYFPGSAIPQELNRQKPGLLKRLFPGTPDMTLRDQAQADVGSLTRLVLEHQNDTVKNHMGEDVLVSSLHSFHSEEEEGHMRLYPVWKAWYETELNSSPERLLRACILINTRRAPEWAGDVQLIFGPGFHEEKLHQLPTRAGTQTVFLFVQLVQHFLPGRDRHQLALALLGWMACCAPDEKLWRTVTLKRYNRQTILSLAALEPATIVLSGLAYDDEPSFPTVFSAVMSLHERWAAALQKLPSGLEELSPLLYSPLSQFCSVAQMRPNTPLMLLAGAKGLISRQVIYRWLLTSRNAAHHMKQLSLLSAYHRLQGAKPAADRWGNFARSRRELQKLYLGHEVASGEHDAALLAYADEVCQPLLERIIDGEIRRGDAPGEYTRIADGVTRVDGAEAFTRILAALGKDKLIRGITYSAKGSRTESLCGLMHHCVPLPEDTGESLRQLVRARKISDARLIEAALYCPDWIELVSEALGMPGFTSAAYYFMAHMNEDFDEARMARIARYTPLTADELNNGAFDIAWFRSAYETLGEKQFDLVYDAAKYITSGAKHARARKYADAVLGRLDAASVKEEIIAKRNKDLLMAYPLIPLGGEQDVQARYLYLQQFLKESRIFGAQRSASEKTAVEIALQNLAMNAGYADAMRLTLRMETRLTEENADLFEPREIEGTALRLLVDGQGVASIECLKAGKPQKSIPAKLKKNEYVLRLTGMKKQLTEQQKRAKRMLEEAMENSSVFTAGEIAALMANPVIAPMLAKTVFMQDGRFGFTDGLTLTDETGTSFPLNPADDLVIAHPFHLWQAKKWLPFQRKLFDDRIVQPFRQVFRELYIKTPEEMERTTSLRYAGHQLQPKRTLACLKTRRWIADPEAGLQKVYYKENIVATIWALADWFTPADIEAPTLEHVAFLDRRTGKPLEISKVPEVLFSEVMRDVDLAVSVAHAGGVDPESSHSTIEMRAALLAFTLPLFRLTNVVIQGSHTLIDGQLARYSVHLGSGVVHQRGGTMLSVLPVHSQHRGRLFLPFADDDPKTAEVLSKVLLFAEDGKLKDPTILEQIIQ